MIFVTGPRYAGKREYIRHALGLSREAFSACAVSDVQDLVENEDNLHRLADTLSKNEIVIADEMGCGVVPMDKAERARREAAGQLSQLLAARASAVVRVVCGIGQVLKGSLPEPRAAEDTGKSIEIVGIEAWESGAACQSGSLTGAQESTSAEAGSPAEGTLSSLIGAKESPSAVAGSPVVGKSTSLTGKEDGVKEETGSAGPLDVPDSPQEIRTLYLIRHGQTAYNAERRYQGQLDIPLTEAAKAALVPAELETETVFISPLCRCRETAERLFPGTRLVAVPDLVEMDFGVFDGRTADEMENDPDYRAWVEGGCDGVCPGGENRKMFTDRVTAAICRILRESEARKPVVIVAHGGVQMALLDALGPGDRPYYMWQTAPGKGLRLTVRIR